MNDYRQSYQMSAADRAKLLATFEGVSACGRYEFKVIECGAWPKEADVPLGYDERDAKV